jgi:Zn-dependent M16 (insulinase) family peptidase
LQPDPEKGKMDEAQELDRLAKVKASMTSADLAELAHATEELRLKQETPDPPEALKNCAQSCVVGHPKGGCDYTYHCMASLFPPF